MQLSELSVQRRPALATILQGIDVPRHDGETLFADMIAAYAALPERRGSFLPIATRCTTSTIPVRTPASSPMTVVESARVMHRTVIKSHAPV